ncbi:MAG: YlxR family protein [Chloroflexota bacterium]
MAKKSQSRKKHSPQRTCIACREKTDKRQLIRIVRTPEGEVAVDLTGKRNGRGAYVCNKIKCWERIASSHLLNQALKAEISAEEKAAVWEQKPSRVTNLVEST